MTQRAATYIRGLDPRLKMGMALILGPSLWLINIPMVTVCAAVLLFILVALSSSQPLGAKVIRSLFLFVLFWVGIKIALEALSGIPLDLIVVDSGALALRLAALLMLGLSLALSTSARSLGLAVSWAIRPFVGAERAWKVALSLALMIHFLPMCLGTMTQVNETLTRRCPRCGFRQRMVILPQAVIRNLGQKTWSQTLAVAGRGLESGDAWKPDFAWTVHDSLWVLFIVVCVAGYYFI